MARTRPRRRAKASRPALPYPARLPASNAGGLISGKPAKVQVQASSPVGDTESEQAGAPDV